MTPFSDEAPLSAAEKESIRRDWRSFIQNGFRWADFTPRLYRHLIQAASFIAHFDRRGFWSIYFEHTGPRLLAFLNQFGGDYQSAELGGRFWLEHGSGTDLKRAMCAEMEAIKTRLNAPHQTGEPDRDLGAIKRRLAATPE